MELNLKIEGIAGYAQAKINLPDELLQLAHLAGRATFRRFVVGELSAYLEGLVEECVKNGAIEPDPKK